MKTKPSPGQKDFNQDMKTFQKLPVRTQEAEILRDQVEKSIGPATMDLQKKIRNKARAA